MNGFLDLRRLRYFKAIAEHGSLSAASRSLNLAQPALSHHVAKLEESIGVPILRRRRDGVELTKAGELLLRHATDIMARVEAAEIDLRRLARDDGAKIKIRLAVISSLAADLTPIVVSAFRSEVPDVVLRVTESGTQDSRELIEKGKADFAVYLVAESEKGELPLAKERLYLVTAGETAGPTEPVPFAEAARQRLVLPAPGNPLRTFIENAAARAGLPLNVALEVDGPGPRRNAVLAGLGSTIFGAHSVHGRADRAGVTARPIVDPMLFRPIGLEARKGLDPQLVERVRSVLARSLRNFGGVEVVPPESPPS